MLVVDKEAGVTLSYNLIRRTLSRRTRRLACVLIAAAGCTGSSSSSATGGSSIESAGRTYTEAILRGTAQDVNASTGAGCTDRAPDAGLAAVRTFVDTRMGIAIDTLRIVSVETRNVTGRVQPVIATAAV